MFSLLKFKSILIGLLLAAPPIAAWIIRQPDPAHSRHATPHPPQNLRIPLEVHTKGQASKLVYVEVEPHQNVPEPNSILLTLPASLLTLRRHRAR